MNDLPKGVYYEPSRDRYRVRLYKYNCVVHCSYHKTQLDAMRALDSALSARSKFQKPVLKPSDGSDTDLLARLNNHDVRY